ncbi:MAG: zinc dependent phospholipase C family protein [Oscillospiraceae bacterium]|nr:zinc dependent phospholipase C family protein [Oscillospiraceae bacterium]
MQTKDHLALGKLLLNLSDCNGLHKHRRAFLLGCVEPDYNMVTYTRGMRKHKKFRGHNAENSLAHIEKCLSEFQTGGLQSAWDYFTLGTMLHYAADAFTWPHNEFWYKSLVQHAIYEGTLHKQFLCALNAGTAKPEYVCASSLKSFFEGNHARYRDSHHDMKTDCNYIISVCMTMLSSCLSYAEAPEKKIIILKEVDLHESPYHHGLV